MYVLISLICSKMRATAMKDRDKLRRLMNSLIRVDQGGPFDWSWLYRKNEDETQETKE